MVGRVPPTEPSRPRPGSRNQKPPTSTSNSSAAASPFTAFTRRAAPAGARRRLPSLAGREPLGATASSPPCLRSSAARRARKSATSTLSSAAWATSPASAGISCRSALASDDASANRARHSGHAASRSASRPCSAGSKRSSAAASIRSSSWPQSGVDLFSARRAPNMRFMPAPPGTTRAGTPARDTTACGRRLAWCPAARPPRRR